MSLIIGVFLADVWLEWRVGASEASIPCPSLRITFVSEPHFPIPSPFVLLPYGASGMGISGRFLVMFMSSCGSSSVQSSSPSLASSSSISSLASSSKKGGSSSGGGRSGGSTPTQYHDEATRSRKHRGGRRRFESGAGGSAEETEEEDIPVSDLYDWSADMFCEPMLRKEKEVEEEEANQRGWRIKTADAFMETTLREQHSEGCVVVVVVLFCGCLESCTMCS